MAGCKALENRWIESRFNKTAKTVNEALGAYRFDVATDAIYHFFWDDYANWYMEYIKPQLHTIDRSVDMNSSSVESLTTMVQTFEKFMRLLHPFMPFITEELWQAMFTMHNGLTAKVCGYHEQLKSVVLAPYPTGDGAVDDAAEVEMDCIRNFIGAVRNTRAKDKLIPRHLIDIAFDAPADIIEIVERNLPQTKHMANINSLTCTPSEQIKVAITNVIEVAKRMAS